jgi:hypothetical protein
LLLKSELNKLYEEIKKILTKQQLSEEKDILHHILCEMNIDIEKYYQIISHADEARGLILERKTALETMINNYNDLLFMYWNSNMDLQYVLELMLVFST